MKQSEYYIPTLKDVSSDVQMKSHKLMLKAGLVRNLAAGVFSWLPAGWKVIKKIQNILREEMDAIGGQEFHLPALNPIEIWEATNRVEAMGDVMFHIKNRDGLILAPTHEEVITYHAKQHVSSYKDMPMIWYQIQNKFRNEPRPRSGVLRGRQFFMKDAYSLDSSYEGLDVSYEKHYKAYESTFNRCGIEFFVVGASSGAMGGTGSQEFMVENQFGEDVCAVTDSGYAANLEVATSAIEVVSRKEENPAIEEFETPYSKSINDLVEHFNLPVERCAKSLIYFIDKEPVLILMRGNDELNEEKLKSVFGTGEIRPAQDIELKEITGANAGSIGPVGLKTDIKIYVDNLLKSSNGLYAGANKDGYHIKNIDLDRDTQVEAYHDFRTVLVGEPSVEDGKPLRVVNAIELGHIFKLGTRYSEGLEATFLDENGKSKPIVMGSYGIGVERIMACYIEQNYDERGIIWNKELTPFDVHIIAINYKKSPEVQEVCERVYKELKAKGIDVLLDDRDESVGFKFNDADLIGIPTQLVIGSKELKENSVELKDRRSGNKEKVPADKVVEYLELKLK